jgi:hypothetical protein
MPAKVFFRLRRPGARADPPRQERRMSSHPHRKFFRHGLLPQLMAFEACVRHGSVTRAAGELSLAQPTVSGLLRKLSETLGGPVTMQCERRIVATALGEDALVLARAMLAAFERYGERRARYDRAHSDPCEHAPCPSVSPSDPPSPSKPPA